jgi:endonuclease G
MFMNRLAAAVLAVFFGASTAYCQAPRRTTQSAGHGTPAPLSAKLNAAMGLPAKASADPRDHEHYLLSLPQYTSSYNNTTRTANWTSWHLNRNSLPRDKHFLRQPFFTPNPSLPRGFVVVQHQDYSADGFDRGHMCPAADRSMTEQDNQATFLTTNIVPQAPNNNQKAWERFERQCREYAFDGHELFIVCGPWGKGGEGLKGKRQSIGHAGVQVPAKVWKVALLLPAGKVDPREVGKDARMLAVIMPNDQSVGDAWKPYETTVAQVEKLTGYNFFPLIDPGVAKVLKNRDESNHAKTSHPRVLKGGLDR